MPTPDPQEQRPPAAGETPLQAAPPIPGAAGRPVNPEQRLGPAPAVPASGGTAAGGGAERPLAHAPLPQAPLAHAPSPVRPAAPVPQIPAAPAVPRPGPLRPSSQESPLRGVVGGPAGVRPEVPLARPNQVRGAAPAPPAAIPAAGPVALASAAVPTANPAPSPAAAYGPPAAATPVGMVGQPAAASAPGQQLPPGNPAWFQPPAVPPPVPPPSPGGQPSEPPPPRPIAWSPQGRSGPVGSSVSAALNGSVQPATVKTSTAKSLRRESRARSSALALTFLIVAATFLIGMVVVLLVSLTS